MMDSSQYLVKEDEFAEMLFLVLTEILRDVSVTPILKLEYPNLWLRVGIVNYQSGTTWTVRQKDRTAICRWRHVDKRPWRFDNVLVVCVLIYIYIYMCVCVYISV